MTTAQGPAAGVVLVRAPARELDLAVAPRLKTALQTAARPGVTVVLDLQDVTFVDSSALAVVLSAERRSRSCDGALVLAHVSEPVRRVLRLCGLTHLLAPRHDPVAVPPEPAPAVARRCRRRRPHRTPGG